VGAISQPKQHGRYIIDSQLVFEDPSQIRLGFYTEAAMKNFCGLSNFPFQKAEGGVC